MIRIAFLKVISEATSGQGHVQYSDNQVYASPMLPSCARMSSAGGDGSRGAVITAHACRQLRRREKAEIACCYTITERLGER